MAKRHDVHPFKKTAGIQQMFWATFLTATDQLGVSDKDLEILGVPGAPVIHEMAKLLVNGKAVVKQGLRVLVNYGQSLKEMIVAGHYDWKNDDITDKNFKIEGTGEVETWVELIHSGRDMTSDQVITELDKQGLRPAKLEELLALGAQHPDEQRKYPIPALGSSCVLNVYRCVPYLGLDGRGRDLNLRYYGNEWAGYGRFAAVRKS